MGAQAAALLDAAWSGRPLGDVPADGPWDGQLRLDPPAAWDLRRTALLHGGAGLAPVAWDGSRLHLRLPHPVRVAPDLTVDWRGAPPGVAVLRRVLALDDDLAGLWAACDAVPELAGLRPRVLRAPSVWQDLVGALAGTRASYRSTQAMVRRLVGDGPFPSAEQALAADLAGFGHRAPWLRQLAERVAAGWDPDVLLDPALPDDRAAEAVRALPGFGPFATAQVLPLLGRPRPLVLDGWLRAALGGASDAQLHARFAPMGRWAGTGAWLAAVGAPRAARR